MDYVLVRLNDLCPLLRREVFCESVCVGRPISGLVSACNTTHHSTLHGQGMVDKLMRDAANFIRFLPSGTSIGLHRLT